MWLVCDFKGAKEWKIDVFWGSALYNYSSIIDIILVFFPFVINGLFQSHTISFTGAARRRKETIRFLPSVSMVLGYLPIFKLLFPIGKHWFLRIITYLCLLRNSWEVARCRKHWSSIMRELHALECTLHWESWWRVMYMIVVTSSNGTQPQRVGSSCFC